MVSDIWNGNGNWKSDLGDWSLGATPTSSEDAVIQSGTDTLSTAGVADDITVNSNATLYLTSGANLSATGITNYGFLDIATNGGDGGENVTLSGTFNNYSSFVLGNSNLSKATKMTVGALAANSNNGYGSITLWGYETLGTTRQATLDVLSAAPSELTSNVYLHGDSDLEFASGGIATIATGSELQLDGKQSRVSIGASTSNSALTSLTTVLGTLDLEGNWSTGPGGTTVTTSGALQNSGVIDLDVYNADGASAFSVGGVLTNYGSVTVGNTSLSADSTMTVGGLSNLGSIVLWGDEKLGTGEQATFDDLAAAPTTWTGSVDLHGDSDLIFKSGSIESISNGATFAIDGEQSRASIGASNSNSALDKFASNYGFYDEEGDWSTGPGGASVSTTAAFANYGTFYLDWYNADGASSFTTSHALTNYGTLWIGNLALSSNTTMTAASLTNSGKLTILGNVSNSGARATLKITGGSLGDVTDFLRVGGTATLSFGSGTGITGVDSGGYFEIDGAGSRVVAAGGAANSGLANFASNVGEFVMRGDSDQGQGGVKITTTVGFTNTGTTDIDALYSGDGGSTFDIGGALTNSDLLNIGNLSLSGTTKVQATSLANSGSLTLLGNYYNADPRATLTITGGSLGAVTNLLRVGGTATLSFGSGTGITGVDAGGYFEIDGSAASVVAAGGGANSGLADFASNSGEFVLRGDSNQGQGGVKVTTSVSFSNTGTTDIDALYGGDGGSTFAIHGALINEGTFNEGNSGSSGATLVSATTLSNLYGQLNITGSGNAATLSLSGSVVNDASLNVNGGGVLNVTGGYTQNGGETTVNGTLNAANFKENGGATTVGGAIGTAAVIDSGGILTYNSALTSSSVTTMLKLYSAAELFVDAAVSSSQTIDFEDSTDYLQLDTVSSFSAVLKGFADGDVIDLSNTTATSFTYSGGVMDLFNGSTSIGAISFSGSYTAASFTLVSDNRGGTEILDPHTRG